MDCLALVHVEVLGLRNLCVVHGVSGTKEESAIENHRLFVGACTGEWRGKEIHGIAGKRVGG